LKETQDKPQNETMDMLKAFFELNKESQAEFARSLAYLITHPEPTEKQKIAQAAARQEAIERCASDDEAKRERRANCPHRRLGTQWGMFNNSTVIVWHYTNLTEKVNGRSQDGPAIAMGVCQWCQSEFKPSDPDYAEKLSWGVNPTVGIFPMHKSLGIWM
jgi:hypothetical protein